MAARLLRSLAGTLRNDQIASQLSEHRAAVQSRCCRGWQGLTDRAVSQRSMQSAAAWLPAPGTRVDVLPAEPASRLANRQLHRISLHSAAFQPSATRPWSAHLSGSRSASSGLSCHTVMCRPAFGGNRPRTPSAICAGSGGFHKGARGAPSADFGARSFAVWTGRNPSDDDRCISIRLQPLPPDCCCSTSCACIAGCAPHRLRFAGVSLEITNFPLQLPASGCIECSQCMQCSTLCEMLPLCSRGRAPDAMAGQAVNGAPSGGNGAVPVLDWSTVPPVPPSPLLAMEEGDRTAHKRELHTVNVGAREPGVGRTVLRSTFTPQLYSRCLIVFADLYGWAVCNPLQPR